MPTLEIFISNALQIWDLSDPDGKGHLDRRGLFAACKLVALAQDRQDVMVCNLLNECPAPNFGDATAPGAHTGTTLDSLLHLRAQELCHAVGVSAVKRVVVQRCDELLLFCLCQGAQGALRQPGAG